VGGGEAVRKRGVRGAEQEERVGEEKCKMERRGVRGGTGQGWRV